MTDFVENNDQPGIKIRNLMVLRGTDDSRVLQFDLIKNKTRQVTCNCKVRELTLMRIGKETIDGTDFPFFEFFVKEVKPDVRFLKKGSVVYRLHAEHEDWATNEKRYKFPKVSEQGIEIETIKESDRTLSVIIKGPLKRIFQFKTPMPTYDSRGVSVAITWQDPEVNLYVNINLAQTLNVRDGVKLEL